MFHAFAQQGHRFAPCRRLHEVGSEEAAAAAFDALVEVARQHRADACEGLFGGLAERGVAPGLDELGADDQSLEFVAGEHQRRYLVAAAQAVADAGFAVDGGAGLDEVGDVAVDGAFGDGECLGERGRGDDASVAQHEQNLEEAVGRAHGRGRESAGGSGEGQRSTRARGGGLLS